MEQIFTLRESDVAYLVGILQQTDSDRIHLQELLKDEDVFLQIISDPKVFAYTIEQTGFEKVSANLYFYICLFRFLSRRGINNVGIIRYVSNVIAFFSVSKQWQDSSHIWHRPKEHYASLLNKMQKAKADNNQEHMYLLQVHLGDYSLFLSGLYPEYIDYMSEEREGVGIDYYDEMALTGYRAAGVNEAATENSIPLIHSGISKMISEIRGAINDYVYSPFIRTK
jgi:hypothetical protein